MGTYNTGGNLRFEVDNNLPAVTIASTGITSFLYGISGTSASFSSTANVGNFLTVSAASTLLAPSSGKSIEMVYRTDGANDYAFIQAYDRTNSVFKRLDLNSAVTILASGNVGIGTTAPTGTYGKLSVAGGISILNDYNAKLEIGRYSSGTSNSYIKLGASSNSLRITNNTDLADLVTFENSGRVGIGQMAPGVALSVAGQSEAWQFGVTTVTGTAGALIGSPSANVLAFGDWSGNESMRFNSDRHALFGTTGTSWQTVVGTYIFFQSALNVTRNGAEAMNLNRLTSDGNILRFHRAGTEVGSVSVTTSLTSYNVTSDYRLKQDLKSVNGLDLVNKINVYNYQWKSDNTRMDGVLAHELAEVLPYAVNGVKDGEHMQQVDYSKIVPVAIKAIQETDSKVVQLEKKIVILEAEIQTLKNK